MPTRPLRRAAAALALLPLAATACADTDPPADAPAPTAADFPPASLEGLRVLIGNDDSMRGEEADGTDGLGLYALRAALCESGADVVVFAPWAQQSSMSAALSHEGAFGLGAPPDPPREYADACSDAPSGGAVHGVCVAEGPCRPDSPSATPVDALSFALAHGLPEVVGWDGPPDLVVSGVNSGPNVASQIPHSGTVGVASTAVAAGVPAIALSASVDEDLVVTPETLAATAAFGTDLIARMHGADLFDPGYVVNVNHPASPDGSPGTDVRWTRAGTGSVLAVDYEGEDAFTPVMRLCEPDAPGCAAETREDADAVALLAGGAVSVSALTVDRAYASGEEGSRVEDLAALVAALGAD
ncbi:5'/3'-nucleotidase SurE [Nocardiopsis sp. CC223A]|uniref:5'/3'-nucleotidase SurE n=1 Tax=Nocardiopsis sp. CC223A TaxID=3044051 RepID=UPI0027961AFA|nr:5'/3'-nucleotidase SurE [Nocardiopsis sp. CC223A]